MGKNIKIELELPEFDKELVVSVTLKKDGEVTTVTSSPSGVKTDVQGVPGRTGNDSGNAWKQSVDNKPTSGTGTAFSGNMMDANF